MKHTSYLLLLTFYLSSSCTEDYRLPAMDDSHILVVNGCITNEEGPYRIRLTDNTLSLSDDGKTIVVPVTEARLTITDNLGNVDELKPLWKEQVVDVQKLAYIEDDGTPRYWLHRYLLMPDYHGGYDSIQVEWRVLEDAVGTYYTTSITGKPDCTYTLGIEYQGRTYTATDRMPYGTVIDSIVLHPIGKGVDGKGYDGGDIPHLYFAEPQDETNYYLLTYGTLGTFEDVAQGNDPPPVYDFKNVMADAMQSSWSTWNFNIVSDRFLPPYVENFKVNDGATAISWVSGTDQGWVGRWGYADIHIASISYTAYRYYYSLIEQFYQDGNTFSPAPSTPPTNVSNGGQGFFMATSVSQKRVSRSTGNF